MPYVLSEGSEIAPRLSYAWARRAPVAVSQAVSWVGVGLQSLGVAWTKVVWAATSNGPATEAQGILAAGTEKDEWGVSVAGKENAPRVSGGAWVPQLLFLTPAALGGPVPSASKEMRADTATRGRAHVSVDSLSWKAWLKRPRSTVLSIGTLGRACRI